jgi:hypothetical protein
MHKGTSPHVSQQPRIENEIHRLGLLSVPAAFVAAGSAAVAAGFAAVAAAVVEAVPVVAVKMSAACGHLFRYRETQQTGAREYRDLKKLNESTHLKQSDLHEILLVWSDFG